MNLDFTHLYIKGNDGNIREWRIGVDNYTIVIWHGVLGGSLQMVTEEVPEGKAGRTREDQIMSRLASRISRRIDMGYTRNLDEAMNNKATNRLGLFKPMLAQPFKNVPKFNPYGAFVQRKYDGNRCIIGKVAGEIVCYSRNGKLIAADLSHITSDLVLEEGDFLDGELYCHGEKLQTIVSWIKRDQESTKRLKYHVYDLISDDPYGKRLIHLVRKVQGDNAEIVPTEIVDGMEKIMDLHKVYLLEGYEGTIIRWSDSGYEDGKRSKSLIKLKSWMDDEFLVVNIHESKDGWAILECDVDEDTGQTFRVSAPGSIAEKIEILENSIDYIGKMVTVEYSALTIEGKPFHPVAKVFRDYE